MQVERIDLKISDFVVVVKNHKHSNEQTKFKFKF